MQTHRIDDELRVVGLFPILQISQIIDKGRFFKISTLTKVYNMREQSVRGDQFTYFSFCLHCKYAGLQRHCTNSSSL